MARSSALLLPLIFILLCVCLVSEAAKKKSRLYNGCVLSGISYPSGAVFDDGCVIFRCNRGVWDFKRLNDNDKDECGMCELKGDPHITPFEPHYLNNYYPNPLISYNSNNTGNIVVSQPGGLAAERFGVQAEFETCNRNTATCVANVTYYEPGVEVNLILPVDLGDVDFCFYEPYNWNLPQCSTTKILVNNLEYTFEELAPATAFSGTDGTILIFKESCEPANSGASPDVCQVFYVVGSQGYTIRLLVDPSADYGYSLGVYASQSQLFNNTYGLCDVFTGETVTDGFTCRPGTCGMITDYNNLNEFIDSWEIIKIKFSY